MSKLLGHSDTKVTQRYAYLSDDGLKKAPDQVSRSSSGDNNELIIKLFGQKSAQDRLSTTEVMRSSAKKTAFGCRPGPFLPSISQGANTTPSCLPSGKRNSHIKGAGWGSPLEENLGTIVDNQVGQAVIVKVTKSNEIA